MNLATPLLNNPRNSSISETATQNLRSDTSWNSLSELSAVSSKGADSIHARIPTFSITSATSSTTQAIDFSQSQMDRIVKAIAEASNGSQTWTFKSFWIIAVVVTTLTILLPLLAGSIFRFVLRLSYNHKHAWRTAVFVTVLAGLIALDIFIPPGIFLGIFGVPQALLALWKLIQVERNGKKKKRWAGYTTLLAVCIAVDLVPRGATHVKKLIHFGQNIGVTAFIPSAYLFIIWIQTNRPAFSKTQILE